MVSRRGSPIDPSHLERSAVAHDRFLNMFFEEARELLQALEAGLIDLEARRDDREHLDRTFRAAHTLKGAAGMVGLPTIAGFTHDVEAILDLIRGGKLAVRPEVISVLLDAKDHLATAVEARSEGRPDPVPSPMLVERLLALAKGTIPAATAHSTPCVAISPIAPPPNADECEVDSARPARGYRIVFTPNLGLFRAGINPLGMLDELRELGPVRILPNFGRLPALDLLDPLDCYLGWTIDLETNVSRAKVEEVFLFANGPGQVAIEAIADEAEVPALPPTMSPSNPPPAAPLRQKPATPSRVRVDAEQLDSIIGMAGELAVLTDTLQGLQHLEGIGPWAGTLEGLERVGRRLRDTTLDLRMVAVEELFLRFPRVVRDLAERSGKQITVTIEGEETRLDRTIIERLADPMIHLIRNAVDHGLETPAGRVATGKSPVGKIRIAAAYEGDRVAIRIEDDGRGLDRAKILMKGVAAGLLPPETPIDDPRIGNVIFEAGFSTRDVVGELSGRGVGLDVVRDAIRSLRGSVSLRSVEGKGTAFLIRLPLTLAMIDGLLIESLGGRFVVPMGQVDECVAVSADDPRWSMNGRALIVRGELVPVITLGSGGGVAGPDGDRRELLLTRYAEQRVGVAVDRLLGRVQAVTQPLGDGLGDLRRYSGATILGDGSICLILDLATLVSEAHARGIPQANGAVA